MYKCTGCNKIVCPACANRGRSAAEQDLRPPLPAAPDTPMQPSNATATSALGEHLLRLDGLLRELPAVRVTPTLQWIPRGFERRYAAARLRPLELYLDAEDANLPVSISELWSRLAIAMPHLLLRGTRAGSAGNEETAKPPASEAEPSIRHVIRERLIQAEKGDYEGLVSGAIEAERHAKAARSQQRDRAAVGSDDPRAFQHAAAYADTGQLRSAARSLRGEKLLPATSITADAIEELYVTACVQRDGDELPERPSGCAATVMEKHVRDHLRDARGTAHPGPSGERNSHITSLLTSPRAAGLLRRWSQAWANGSLRPEGRNLWLQAIVVGGDKGGGRARAIVFQESLLKLATSAIVRTQHPAVRRAAGDFQFGIYHPGGAPQVAWEVRAHMASYPEDLFFAQDMRNGFGTARRGDAYNVAIKDSPGMAGLYYTLWYDGAQSIMWVETEDGWRQITVRDGFPQGACEAQPAFGAALWKALTQFFNSVAADPELRGKSFKLWAFVDDLTLRVPRCSWRPLMQYLRSALAAHGLELRADKGKAHCPAADAEDIQKLSDEVAEFACYQADGLPILGTVANGAFATIIRPGGGLSSPIVERTGRAVALGERLGELATAPIEQRRLAPCWKLVEGVLNHALAYDACVLEPSTTVPHADALDNAVAKLLPNFVGAPVPSELEEQMRLPRASGGCGLPSAADRCHTSFLAHLLALLPEITKDLMHDGMLEEQIQKAFMETGLLPAGDAAIVHLRNQGVFIDTYGMAHRTPPQRPLDLRNLGTTPLRHRQRGWRTLLAELRAERLGDPTVRKHVRDTPATLRGRNRTTLMHARARLRTCARTRATTLMHARACLRTRTLACEPP